MESLTEIALRTGTDKATFHHYTEIYQQYLEPLRHKPIRLLEIGYGGWSSENGYKEPNMGGESAAMFKSYFDHPDSEIVVIDIEKKNVPPNAKYRYIQGSQTDDEFMRGLGSFDCLVDDGSHMSADIIQTFNTMFPQLNFGGIYIIEDTQTSYFSEFSPMVKTTQYFKTLTDGLNHAEIRGRPNYIPTYFDRFIYSIHFYHNLIIILKGDNTEPSNIVRNAWENNLLILMEPYLINKNGLEIGGSSSFFDHYYPQMQSCDNVVFSSKTMWGSFGKDFIVNGKKLGKQYIMEGTDLSSLKKTYDFVLSCNNIEHIANPMKAIEQWVSVLKKGGALIVVAPRKESNFDHNREVTAYAHLLDDYKKGIGENDLTHLPEILKLHDLTLDPPAGTLEQFKARSLKNIENRCLHHHVFDHKTLRLMFEYFGLQVIYSSNIPEDYIIGAIKNK